MHSQKVVLRGILVFLCMYVCAFTHMSVWIGRYERGLKKKKRAKMKKNPRVNNADFMKCCFSSHDIITYFLPHKFLSINYLLIGVSFSPIGEINFMSVHFCLTYSPKVFLTLLCPLDSIILLFESIISLQTKQSIFSLFSSSPDVCTN